MLRLEHLRPFHYAASCLLLGYGAYWFLKHGYWAPINFIVPVYPVSFIMLGLFLFALDRRYGLLAIPLLVMSIGALDVLGRVPEQEYALVLNLSPSLLFQIVLMVGGYFLAGRPHFQITPWFWLMLVSFLLFVDSRAYHIFNATFYLYILTSIKAERHFEGVDTMPISPQKATKPNGT